MRHVIAMALSKSGRVGYIDKIYRSLSTPMTQHTPTPGVV